MSCISYFKKYIKNFQIKKKTKQTAGVCLKEYNNSKAFIQYSNDMDNVYENIEEYNPDKKRKILVVFDDMIADMLGNKKT